MTNDHSDSGEKVNILIVDDRQENLLAMEAVLDRLGENLVKASSGKEALRHLLHDDFAVILLDAQMPEMDGFETASLIRQRDKSSDTPIIFMTAINKSAAHVFRGYTAGAVDYLFKPFEPEVLRSKVRVFVNLFRETREAKKHARQLHELQLQYQAILRATPQGICTLDKNWKIMWHNQALSATLDPKGRNTSALVGLSFSSFFLNSRKFFDFAEPAKKVIRRAGISIQEVSLQRYDGTKIFCEISLVKLDPSENSAGYVATLSDITDRKNAENALRESEERYALSAEGAADGLWDWDLRTNEIYFSPRWKSILGYEPSEIGTSPDEWIKRIEPEFFEVFQYELNAHLEGSTDHFESEFQMRHRDGSLRWVLCRGLAIRDTDGKAERMAGSLSDVTRRKSAEEELVKKERLATMGMTIAHVAHSMKNILQAVNGSLYFVERSVAERAPEDLAEPVGILKSALGRLNLTVLDMLDYSKERAPEMKEIDCAALFEDVRNSLLVPAEKRGARLEFQVQPGARILLSDPARLTRALVNLGINAIEAIEGDEGRVTFIASVRKVSELGLNGSHLPPKIDRSLDALVLEVRDNGIGIPEENLEKVFEPFFSTKASMGTGIGLSSVREFVKEQGGTILVDSELGKGTSFRLIFFDSVPAEPMRGH